MGHVFRKRRPYGSDGDDDAMVRNSLRVAHVWMDEFVDKYLEANPAARSVEFGDVGARKALRNRLGCQSFQWYLQKVYPEFDPQAEEEERRKRKQQGEIR